MRKLASVFVLIVASIAFSIGCGGGNGPNPDASVSDLYGLAMAALKAGDIPAANGYFDAALSSSVGDTVGLAAIVDPEITATGTSKAGGAEEVDLSTMITQSYFGRAFTDLLLLVESQPLTDILAGFGQQPWQVDTIFGPAGYFKRINDIYGADVNIEFTGDIGESYIKPTGETWLRNAIHGDAQYTSVIFSSAYRDINSVWVSILTGATQQLGGTCSVVAGDEVDVGATCIYDIGTNPYETEIVSVGYAVSLNEGYSTGWVPVGQRSGTITVHAVPSAKGDSFSVTLNDVLMMNGAGDSVIVNGTVLDFVTEYGEKPTRDGFPFDGFCKNTKCVFGNMMAGYSFSDAILSFSELMPLLDGIAQDLESAVGDLAAYFDLPKELYYGDEDLRVSKAEMKLLLSGVYALKTGINFMNSWNFDMEFGDMYDSEGRFSISKQELVDRLNAMFGLRSDHQLAAARDNFAQFFAHALSGMEEIINGSRGGFIDPVEDAGLILDELYDLVHDGNQAMSGLIYPSAINPAVGVDLEALFNDPPDGDEIAHDAFVLEGYNNIAPVEMYFKELAERVCTFDIEARPDLKWFSQAVRNIVAFEGKLFFNLLNRKVGGYRLTWEERMQYER